MTFGTRITRERRRLGLTQDEFGQLVGASKRQVQKWEADDVRPNAVYLSALSAAGVDVLYLISDRHLPERDLRAFTASSLATLAIEQPEDRQRLAELNVAAMAEHAASEPPPVVLSAREHTLIENYRLVREPARKAIEQHAAALAAAHKGGDT